MKKRHVFSTDDIHAARSAVDGARRAGITDDNISLVARHDIENLQIPDDLQDIRGDFNRGGLKGLLAGGSSGLLMGLVAIAVPSFGVTLAGAVAMTTIGAAVGGWTGMLTGAAEPGPVRRKFEDEIAAGHVLIAIDGEKDELAKAEAVLKDLGAVVIPLTVSPTGRAGI